MMMGLRVVVSLLLFVVLRGIICSYLFVCVIFNLLLLFFYIRLFGYTIFYYYYDHEMKSILLR